MWHLFGTSLRQMPPECMGFAASQLHPWGGSARNSVRPGPKRQRCRPPCNTKKKGGSKHRELVWQVIDAPPDPLSLKNRMLVQSSFHPLDSRNKKKWGSLQETLGKRGVFQNKAINDEWNLGISAVIWRKSNCKQCCAPGYCLRCSTRVVKWDAWGGIGVKW